MDLPRALSVCALLASGCGPIPDLWPEAVEACQDIGQACHDTLAKHFESEIEDELTEEIYLRGVRWMVRWDIDAADVDDFDRAPGDGLTQRLYNFVAHKIRRSTDDSDLARNVDVVGRTAYVGRALYYQGYPDDVYCCGSVPANILDDFLYPDEDAMIEVLGAAFDSCMAGVPTELEGECFPWWGWSEHYDYEANGW